MTSAATNPWLDSLLAGQTSVPQRPHAWLNALRAEALERAHSLTVPTTRDEDWRFTDLSPLYKLALKAADTPTQGEVHALGSTLAPEAEAQLVFVNGRCANEV